MMTTAVSALGAWLATYLVHSTLLLGGVAALTRWVVRREALRETLWKAALVGGVVTATVALALPRPGALRIDLAALDRPSTTMAASGAAADRMDEGGRAGGAGSSADVDTDRETDVDRETDIDRGTETVRQTETVREPAAPGTPATDVSGDGLDLALGAGGSSGGGGGSAWWLPLVVGLWAAVGTLLLGRLGYRHARLRWLLRDRRQVPGSEPAAVALTELRRTAGVWKPVRLTASPSVATPLALGAVEVCVPERFLEELGQEEQRAALAHELAHLARRDPVWQVVGSALGALFFFQPLNGVARRAIRSTAEYLADAWAVSQTGSRVELARCLAAVAGWVAPAREPALAGTVAMAEGGSPLLARVQRLLDREPEPPTAAALRVALAAGLVAVAAGFAPAVGGQPSSTGAQAMGEVLAGDSPVASLQDSVIIHRLDRPGLEGDGFVERLNEAGRASAGAPYWVAYALSSAEGARRVAIDSWPWQSRDVDGQPVAAVLGVEGDLGAVGPYPVLVLVRLDPRGATTRVDRVALRKPAMGMPLSGAVYWLGGADTRESFRWFRDMYTAAEDPDLRETLVEVAGVHDSPEAGAFLRRVLSEDRDTDTRTEAMDGLSSRADTALARLFFDLAMSDPSADIRQEATEQLGRSGVPIAVALLEQLAWESRDGDVQRQAAESLGEVGTADAAAALSRLLSEHPSERVRREALDQASELDGAVGGLHGAALLRMALTEDEENLRREAVERIAELPPEDAVPLLRRAAFESGDEAVERQAAESLGEVRTEAAYQVLIEILERNPGEAASFQAVESLEENFPRDKVIPVLRNVLYAHPSEKVRREALDVLGDLGG